MNSILQSLQSSSVVAGVVQMLRSPKLDNKILIIIEGEDDKKVYSCFFKEETTDLYPLGGCLHMEEILNKCNPMYNSRYIVLKDADFDHLNDIAYSHPNLFLTDTHDAETMMINAQCIKAICYEYLCSEIPSFISDIYNDLAPLGYIKWYNSIHHLKINFDILKIANLYNGTAPLNLSSIIQMIYSNPANEDKIRISKQEISTFIEAHADVNPLLLLNGHDICECMAIKLRMLGSGNINKSEMPRNLRLMYKEDLFRQTTMYIKISDWADSHNFKILKN